MSGTSSHWPFGLNRNNWPLFAIAAALAIAAATLVDAPVTRWVAALPQAVRDPFHIITRAGNSDWILIPSLIIALASWLLLRWYRGTHRRLVFSTGTIAAFIFAGVAIPGIVALLIKRLVGRARPPLMEELGVYHFAPALNEWTLQSFPSGDTTTIFSLAALLFFLVPRFAWLFFSGAVLVSLSRIMVGLHFPSDVLGGIVLGTLGAYAVRNYWLRRGWLSRPAANGAVRPPARASGHPAS